MIKNKFIVIEGLEGAGKTHACMCVKNILNQFSIKNILLVRQPGSTPIAEDIRKLIKKKFDTDNLIKETELLLMYAARIQLFEKKIKPALKNGIWVISDRHDLSTLAYQGGGLGIKKKIITKLKSLFLHDFIPDLTIYLDVSPKIGLERALRRNPLDSIESRSLEFFKKTRKYYLKNVKLDQKTITINANLNIKTVTQNITKKILNWLNKKVI
ncbi:thymidylate kinase [Buchnera aphidicola str. Ak (Acyrthosiphon kondoi)]|uniref:Thymidylate kinase n=1 Tax=Buchnera aphidicola str. Ak (Acyrthosiphon kondoi) TaxID=1005090 RepID=G2LN62_9GAMM|nr:dTMP kinase [Buchnera aphidicola]AEO08700.1 thymidylate kinase [Buchnera aphidicola str. Ak (Acyrthosiphon kondoi)]WAI18492.1 MAG: dTMP kinase [Buchnera aphidicola (Acyrthosiphon caraganae)]